MKRFNYLILGLAALVAGAACQRENPVDTTPAVRFGSVPVSLEQAEAGDGTRSLVSIDVENFKVASLFAFYHDNGEIAVYPEHAGDLEGNGPVAIEVTQKSFNWALPLDRQLDIYVIVNYGDALASTLAGYRADAGLTEDELNQLKFNVTNFNTMSDIAANGIPMAGVVSTTLTNANSPLNVSVKRLYARYNLYFDLSDLQAHGATLQAMHVVTERVNTEIPFFQEGFQQTVSSKFQEYDRATATDLDVIQQGGNAKQLTLYVPENCQGNISGASSWKEVIGLGSRVVNCTYVDFGVKIVDADGLWKNYNFYLYLGTDFTTNFDVKRNYNTTVSIKIPYMPDPGDKSADYFYWSDHNLVSLEPGQSVSLDYSTSLSPTEISFVVYDNDTNAPVSQIISDSNKTASSARFTASSSAVPGKTYRILGGKAGAQDNKPVSIASSTVVLEDLVLECQVFSTYSNTTLTGHGENMNITVDPHDGNRCDFVLNARVKYDGQWHQMTPQTGNPEPRISFWMTGMGADVSANRTVLHWGKTLSEYYMPGDVDEVRVYFDDYCIASWYIYYGSSGSSPYMTAIDDVALTCTATVLGQPTNTYTADFNMNGGNMNVPVDVGGCYISYSVSGQFKWHNNWYDLDTWMVDTMLDLTVDNIDKPLISATSRKIVPGDRVHFELYDGNTLIASWYVTGVSKSN